jgi:hypothetical protein
VGGSHGTLFPLSQAEQKGRSWSQRWFMRAKPAPIASHECSV